MASSDVGAALYKGYVDNVFSGKEPDHKELLDAFLKDVLSCPDEFAGGQWMVYNHSMNQLMALSDNEWNSQLNVYYNTVDPPFQGCVEVSEASRNFEVCGLSFKVDTFCVCATDTSSTVPNSGMVPGVLVGWNPSDACHIYVAKVVVTNSGKVFTLAAGEAASRLRVGAKVRTTGLKTEKYNKKTGVIVARQGERWGVRLDDGEEKAFKGENLDAEEVSMDGNQDFEMDDVRREAYNMSFLEEFGNKPAGSDQILVLANMRGRLLNLANAVPDGLAMRVKDGINVAIMVTVHELQQENDTSVAQALLDVAGPPKGTGSRQCNPWANGWIFNNILDDDNKQRIEAIQASQI